MIDKHFAILGALIAFLGSASYAIDTLKGKTRPNRVQWLLWTIAPLIAFVAEVVQHVGLASLLTFAAGFGPLIVMIASFTDRKAYWKLSRFDIFCGFLSVAALAMWAITGKGNIAIVFSILSDFFAAIPTIIKSYTHPETESASAFFTGTIGGTITLLTIKPESWNFASYGFPLYILLVTLLITILIVLPRSKQIATNT